MVSERRQTERHHVVWKALICRHNGEQLLGSTANVSANGMYVIVDRPMCDGERLRVNVLSRCTGRACYCSLDAMVVYSRLLDANLGNAVGLQLIDPDVGYLAMVDDREPLKQIGLVG